MDVWGFLQNGFDWLAESGGEVVQYVPRTGSGRVPRSISAVVERKPREPIQGRGSGPLISVTVKNDSVEGIWSGELDNGDKIAVAERVGKTAVEREIMSTVEQDTGMLTLELR